jgi:hypothetical protein
MEDGLGTGITDLSNGHGMEILKPSIAGLGNLKVEHASVDNLLDIDLAIARLKDLGTVVELLDQV